MKRLRLGDRDACEICGLDMTFPDAADVGQPGRILTKATAVVLRLKMAHQSHAHLMEERDYYFA